MREPAAPAELRSIGMNRIDERARRRPPWGGWRATLLPALRRAAIVVGLGAAIDAVRLASGGAAVLGRALVGGSMGSAAGTVCVAWLAASLAVGGGAARGARGRRSRIVASVGLLMLVVVACFEALAYARRVASGALHGAPVVSFSALVAIALCATIGVVWLAVPGGDEASAREGLASASPGGAWRDRAVREARAWGLVVCAVGGLAIAFVHCFGLTDRRRSAEAIVVLGAKAHADGRPSEALAERVATGVELYRRGLAPRLIMSGGRGEEGVSEPEVMRRAAIERGVAAHAIELDERGVNTEASVREVRRRMGRDGAEVLVVSHYHHLPRVRLLGRLHGVRCVTVPADEGEQRLKGTAYYVVREVLGLALYFVRG